MFAVGAAGGCAATGSSEALDGGSEDTTPHVLDGDEPTTPDDAPVIGAPDALGADGDAAAGDAKKDSGKDAAAEVATDTGGAVVDVGPPDTCAPSCATCGGPDGCGDICKTGACGGGASCVAGACVAPTKSWISPLTYPSSWGAFAKGISWTLASEAPSTIRMTTDGSDPGPTSSSGPSPLTFFEPTSGTTIKWLADDGAAEPVQSFVVKIDTTLQAGYGYVVEETKLDGVSPVVVVAPGATLDGSAKYQAWVSTACPGCRQQLVYGIDSTAAGCLYDFSPSTWPGASGTGAMHLVAPSTPGTYRVRVAWALQLSCAAATTTANPLGVKPTTEVGVIVVK